MLEQVLRFIIFVIIIYLVVSGILWLFDTKETSILGGALTSGVIYGLKTADETPIEMMEQDTNNTKELTTHDNSPKNSKANNSKAKPSKSPKKKKHKNSYDEYDDDNLLNEILPEYPKSFDNIVIDGNNMLFQYAISQNKTPHMSADAYIDNIKCLTAMLDKHFNNKNLYYVFKDSETKKQEIDLLSITKTDSTRTAHKKIFDELYKKYPNTRFVVAYGDEKYRDDYAAIWLADTLPDDTILLSRDRFRDVTEMKSQKLKFTTYGKRASKINKIINKPFNFVTKGSVKSALVGYSFNNTKPSGFYQKSKNKKSAASEIVYIIGK